MGLLMALMSFSCAKLGTTPPFPVLTQEVLIGTANSQEALSLMEGQSLEVGFQFEKALTFDAFVNFEVQGGIGRFLNPLGVVEVQKGQAIVTVNLESFINDILEGTKIIKVVFTSEALASPIEIDITMVDPTSPADLVYLATSPLLMPTVALNQTSSMEIQLKNNGDVAATQMQALTLASPFRFAGGSYPGLGGNCGTVLRSGETCLVVVEAMLASAGVAEETLTMEYFNGSATTTIPLSLKVSCDSVVSTIANGPDSISAAKFLDISIAGYQITSYKYKVGSTSTTQCQTSTGYSVSEIPVGTNIKDNISGIADGSVTLCVVGYNGTSAQWQSYATATFYTWVKDTQPPSDAVIAINNGDAATNLILSNLTLDAVGAQFMYVTNVSGCNSGGEWEIFNRSKVWVLNSMDSDNFVYVKFRDRLGNETDCLDDKIKHDQTPPSVILEQQVSQVDPTLSLPVVFELRFSESVKESFVAQINTLVQQTGTATGVVWGLEKISDLKYYLKAIEVAQGGTIIPTLASGLIEDLAGNLNTSSSTTVDRTVTYNIVQFYVEKMILGEDYTCAASSKAETFCWGNNNHGQLGLGVAAPSSVGTPTALSSVLPNPKVFHHLSAGYDSTCGINENGLLYCWGSCDQGKNSQGDGMYYTCMSDTRAPSRVLAGLLPSGYGITLTSEFLDVAVGRNHGCALLKNGSIQCWGQFNEGQRGNGQNIVGAHLYNYIGEVSHAIVPNSVLGRMDFKALTAGDNHTCALSSNGDIWCWGRGAEGQIGNGSTAVANLPVKVTTSGISNFAGFKQVSAGATFNCALDGTGRIYCWGANDFGQLGNNSTNTSLDPVPVNVSGLARETRFVEVKAGRDHACARSARGEIYCWGRSEAGRLGADYGGVAQLVPVAVQVSGSIIKNAIALEVRGGHSCYISVDAKMLCWGRNDKGQLGDGTQTDSTGLVAVNFGSALSPLSYRKMASGLANTCGVNQNGKVFCWGNGLDGRNGNGISNQTIPAAVNASQLASVSGFYDLAGGAEHICGLTTEGLPFCWGKNAYGQLGTGNTTSQSVPFPVDVSGISPFLGFTQISAGQAHTCALHGDGQLYCWGYGYFGQLGRNSQIQSLLPVPVDTTAVSGQFLQVSNGALHSCALTSLGLAYCWGSGSNGRLGVNSFLDKWVPSAIQVSAFGSTNRMIAVQGGGMHSCGLLSGSGGLWCWGAGDKGQLGNSANLAKVSPSAVTWSGTNGNVVRVSLGDQHSCAINHRHELFCWGNGAYGRIGDGVSLDRNSPSPIDFTPSELTLPQYPNHFGTSAFALGEFHTCSVGLEGNAYCWGKSADGRLGILDLLLDIGTPMKVSDP